VALSFEIFPFSFKEYLGYKNIESNFHSSKSLSFIKNATYLQAGGFVETFDEPSDIQKKPKKILRDYFRSYKKYV